MAIVAKNVLDRARRLIQDETSVRWPLPELRLWLNDGLREIAVLKPTAYSASIVFTLAQGTLQTLPENYASVMAAVRNLKTNATSPKVPGPSLRVVDMDILDASAPNWHDGTKVKYQKTVKNVAFDANNPNAFYVYPGNDGTGFIELIVSRVPDQIAAPASLPDDLNSYSATIDLQDIYFNCLVDYVLYRAYSKDASYAGSAQRAIAHYTAFSNALGVKITNDMTKNLNVKPSVQQENAA
jgi:hypothetical protein